jgi:hypothetical protein
VREENEKMEYERMLVNVRGNVIINMITKKRRNYLRIS